MSPPTEIVSLSFALAVEDGWPPAGVECLPFQVSREGYVAMGAPLFVKDLSAGDVIAVERDAVSGLVVSWRHVEKSDRTTIWLVRMMATDTIDPVLAALRELGCNTGALEAAGAYTIDVPATVEFAAVDVVLARLDSDAVAVAFPSLRHEERLPTDMETYTGYIRDLVYLLREQAAAALVEKQKSGSDFEDGRECGLREALAWMQSQADSFGIPRDEIRLDGFDAMTDPVDPPPPARRRRADDTMTLTPIAGGGEGRLGFVAAALKAFAFLEHLGFSVVRREPTLIRFESGSVFITVYHGRSSYHVGLELGRMQGGELYSLHEVLSVMAPTELDRARCQTADPAMLGRCLTSMAETVERNCRSLLMGNDREFEKLKSVVSSMRNAATLQAKFGAILDRADQAWEQKNLSEAAELYERAAPALDKMRQRRLEYLRSRKKGP